jgi:nucleoside-diphosphate-sugar epimerase
LYRRRVDFFLNDRRYDTGKAERLLGFRPRVGLEDGLGRTVAWCRSRGLLDGSARGKKARDRSVVTTG